MNLTSQPIPMTPRHTSNPLRVCLLGATGTIGRATVQALVARGHQVVCFVRRGAGPRGTWAPQETAVKLAGADTRLVEVSSAESLARDGFRGEPFDALVSCMASRTGAPQDAWAIDYQAHVLALEAARRARVAHFVLLSAICVQKPLLAFQHAKLAFEKALVESGLAYTIVRPTAFFKSLSGQIERVRRGKPFLVFGDGSLTACKPVSDRDLAQYLTDCLEDRSRRDRVLPIGGPGEAITPRQQGEQLFALLDGVVRVLGGLGQMVPAAAEKAELARIGRYYATESMLVLDPQSGRYDAARTPSTGTQTLFDYYARLLDGSAAAERGDHAVF